MFFESMASMAMGKLFESVGWETCNHSCSRKIRKHFQQLQAKLFHSTPGSRGRGVFNFLYVDVGSEGRYDMRIILRLKQFADCTRFFFFQLL